ncbi:HtrA2 peptidase [Calothrix sp. NIES-2100]|nr:HtrA2 peptidase [Calothrix sp. NIES-2100]
MINVAVVKIPANHLPTVGLGNSEGLEPGAWAMVTNGNPLALDDKVTHGMISANHLEKFC